MVTKKQLSQKEKAIVDLERAIQKLELLGQFRIVADLKYLKLIVENIQ